MAEERRDNIMSLELAIQREEAYRRKLSKLQLNLDNDLMPLEVPPSHPTPSPNLTPAAGPSSSPVLSTSLVGAKRKEPTTCLQYLPPQQPQPFHGTVILGNEADNLFCEVCQVHCSGAFSLKQHVEGRKHKGKIEELEHIRKYGGEKANQLQWCELCNISCMNETLLEQHLQGARHREKLQELESGKGGGEILNQPKWCKLCKLWCPCEYNFKQHLEGHKHGLRLQAFQQKKRAK
ncbi:uncharacterized protein LOC132176365 [Corylus avellana]|uniref:uncharacterized protein LOC132176365 n=1 Tax=Corylus avellana TaxID=13451 RepID=UPI001E1FF185|nr:uncharacterized protein LOC132176365 [Corylus avellana]XP_059444532.1 uncharacterized protein LOC132176365 [Corylus avellana]